MPNHRKSDRPQEVGLLKGEQGELPGHPGNRTGLRLYLDVPDRSLRPQEQPVRLARWAIVATEESEMYAAGYALDRDECCVSSRITSIDAAARKISTQGGYAFLLVGEPDLDFYGQMTLMLWANAKGVSRINDVSSQVIKP